MYQPAVPVLWTEVSNLGIKSTNLQLHSNGTYIRRKDGYVIGRNDHRPHPIIYVGGYCDKSIYGHITDKVLVERINTYWKEYYGTKYTNCSAFAHYLTTGEFIECDSKNLLVIEQGMRPYEMVSRVDVGDMLCVMYAEQRYWTSRKNQLSRKYRKVRKRHHGEQGFACTSAIGIRQRSFDPGEIRQLFEDGCMSDYHFMVCVGKRKGEPVWLSQCGRHKPGAPEVPFTVTCGEYEPYIRDVPVLSFIKKRRK